MGSVATSTMRRARLMVTISRSLIKAGWQATRVAAKAGKIVVIMGGMGFIPSCAIPPPKGSHR